MPALLHELSSCSPSHTHGSYLYSLIPVRRNGLAVITSADELLLLDRRTLRVSADAAFSNVPTSLTCVVPAATDGNQLFCAGRDGSVAGFDVRTRNRISHFKTDKAVTALCCHGHDVAIGTELADHQALISVWDIRQSKSRWQSTENNDDITDLHFHPTQPSHILSGGVDGLVSIFNTEIQDEDESLLQVVNHGSVHKSGFLSNEAIYALSHDEQFAIYPVTKDLDDDVEEPPPVKLGDLRPLLHCDYAIDILRVGGDVLLAAGTHKSDPHVDLVPLRMESKYHLEMNDTIRLQGAHGEEIVRSVFVDAQSDSVFTAGEDGYVRVFRAAEVDPTATPDAQPPKPEPKAMKSARYKPY